MTLWDRFMRWLAKDPHPVRRPRPSRMAAKKKKGKVA